MKTQRSVLYHSWHSQNDGRCNFLQWYSATGRFQTYSFTLCHCRIVTDCTTQNELVIHKIYRRCYRTPLKNLDTLETTRMILKSTQTTKMETTTKKERFFITNIIKGHKVTDLTRPNKLGTTTSKVATKSPDRTRLWKWLCAPSHNTAEDNQLRYTVFFKERMQCIQDRYQQHSRRTQTRQGSQASVYPSPMWSWIRCGSALDSRNVVWKDQPRATEWWNESHITRFLPLATTYYLIQCCCKISLPLISFTRLLPLATRLTRLTTHARGLLYFTNNHNHGYGGFRLYNKTLDESK
jgi:hypothetical protein